MIPRIEYKSQVMKEQFREYCRNSQDGNGDGMTYAEYVEITADNDDNFLDFLYDSFEDDFNGYPDEETIEEDIKELINY